MSHYSGDQVLPIEKFDPSIALFHLMAGTAPTTIKWLDGSCFIPLRAILRARGGIMAVMYL